MRKAPLVPVALALMGGILAARLVGMGLLPWAALLAVAAIVLGVVLWVKGGVAHAFVPALVVCFAGGGLLGRMADPLADPADWSRMCGESGRLAVRLCESPTVRERSIMVRTEVYAVDGHSCRGDMRLFVRPDSLGLALRYGDRLLIHGYPDTERRTLYATSDHYVIVGHAGRNPRALCEALRMRLVHRMQNGPLRPRHAGVAEALALGYRGDIEPTTQASFRDAGIAHLLAVSGLHVGLVAAMVRLVVRPLGRERRGRVVGGILRLVAVWLFASFSGLAPSAVRAALMFSLFVVADVTERRTSRLNLLAATAIITLAIRPMLLFDVGWQMSYAAVAGILVAMPLIRAWHNRLWQAAAVSMAATMATTPITLATFHRFHPYFLIANVIVVPMAGIVLALSLIYMVVPCEVTAWPLGQLLSLADVLTGWVASLPGASVEL